MPYIPAGRRHGVAVLAVLLTGLLMVAPSAMAKAAKHSDNTTYTGDQSSAINNYLASTNISSSSCADPTLSQPFAPLGDSNYYALAPGQSDSDFTATNWYLTGGANVVSTTLAHGNAGHVLDLPAGALAISPPMCVAYNYPTARAMVRTPTGSGSVSTYVAYSDGSSYQVLNGGSLVGNGNGNGWGLSGQINLQPSSTPGWQVARFALYSSSGDTQLYNFYVDPYAKR